MLAAMVGKSGKPSWLRVRAPGGETYHALRRTLREHSLQTVCEHARCPNVGTCWREGTATVMLLGSECTRCCRFCGVRAGAPGGVVDRDEPDRVARAIADIGLRYVVLTMVTRDDLPDGGAGIVAATVVRLRQLRAELLVEVLVSDFGGSHAAVDQVLEAAPTVFAHNVEVVRALTPLVRDKRTSYERSLDVLAHAKARSSALPTKSSLMVGVGESTAQVVEALRDLREVGVDLVTIGQYLQPTSAHLPVARYVTPDEFDEYRRLALELGFGFVASGPLVRSSFRAAETYLQARLAGHLVGGGQGRPADVAAPPRSPTPGEASEVRVFGDAGFRL